MQSVKDKHITILGSQRSALGAAKLLSHFGAKVLVSDLDAGQFTAEKRQLLGELGATFEFGYHSPDVLDSDFVVASPGIPDTVDIMRKIRERDIPIYSELEIATWFIEAPIIAVTGSNGKTTTVNLIHHLLQTAGYDSFLGGNVGVAASEVVLDSLSEKPERPVFVLEVSSFQLDHIEHFKPQVAVLLNLTPDHLDRYANLEAYYTSKLGIFKNLSEDSTAILNRDDPETERHSVSAARKRFFALDNVAGAEVILAEGVLGILSDSGWSPILAARELPLPGQHNIANALAAIAAVKDFITDSEIIAKGLRTFAPVPHRIEYVGEVAGIRCYNDSKATNIASTEVAITSFPQPLWLILGGKDKGGDFSSLIPLLEGHLQAILLVGAASEIIENQIGRQVPTLRMETISQAVDHCLSAGAPGDVLLLSPACASFDQFDNYEARGDYFRSLIQNKEGWSL